MRKSYFRKIKNRILGKYVLIIVGLVLLCATILYVFDHVLNGVILDLLRVLLVSDTPFYALKRILAFVFPGIICIASFVMVYFLIRDLASYMSIFLEGIDDILLRHRKQVHFPKELEDVEKYIQGIAMDYEKYDLAAQEDEKHKRDLIYLLAQDIKLPLTNILMYLELLEKEKRISSETKKEFLREVLFKSYDLEDMINEFFDITRFNLQYAKFNPEWMFLDRMVEQVFDEFYGILEEKNIQVELKSESRLLLYADNEKLARVIRDIMRNLVALSYEGGVIQVELKNVVQEYHMVLQASTLHLSADQIAHIFQNYYRLEGIEFEGKKHILGLGIAKAIVDMHEGKILVSSIGEQLRFDIYLQNKKHHSDKLLIGKE